MLDSGESKEISGVVWHGSVFSFITSSEIVHYGLDFQLRWKKTTVYSILMNLFIYLWSLFPMVSVGQII
jgi:hypothetical protein